MAESAKHLVKKRPPRKRAGNVGRLAHGTGTGGKRGEGARTCLEESHALPQHALPPGTPPPSRGGVLLA